MNPTPNQIVVLFGGASNERLVATASAQHVAAEISAATLWFWTNEGRVLEVSHDELIAHRNPFKVEFFPEVRKSEWASLDEALDEGIRRKAIFFLSLHGGEGEDGGLQRKLESRGLAFTGSGSEASAVAFDKGLARKMVAKVGINVAAALNVTVGNKNDYEELKSFYRVHQQIVAKPLRDGSSVGLVFLSSSEELDSWWKTVEILGREYLVEERLFGREFTVGVVDIGSGAQPLPLSEVVITDPGGAFDYDGKYLGRGTREITPATVTEQERAVLHQLGLTAHTSLGCLGYSRTDVIMGPKGTYFLETNTLPGLTRASFIPQQLAASGVSMNTFLSAQIALAVQRYD